MISYFYKNRIIIGIAVISFFAAFASQITHNTPTYPFFMTIFNVSLSFLPLIGGISGIVRSRQWGKTSYVAKAVFWTSMGVLSWGCGQLVWDTFVFLHIKDVPYPSFADFFYVAVYPLEAIGVYYLMKLLQEPELSKKDIDPFFLVLATGGVTLVSFIILAFVAKGGQAAYKPYSLVWYLDTFYTTGSVLMTTFVTVTYIMTRKHIGGIFKTAIYLLLFGYVFQYLGDFLFAIRTRTEIYFNGDYADMCYIMCMLLLSLAISGLSPKILLGLRNKK